MANSLHKTALAEWEELEKEFVQLEEDNRAYTKKMEEMLSLQKKSLAGIAHHRYRTKQIQDILKRGAKNQKDVGSDVKELQVKIKHRKAHYREMEEALPHKNGMYLNIILGQVNVSLLSKNDKYQYKQEYERFKLFVSYIIGILSVVLGFFSTSRWLDAVLHFLLVWYYCTLTIRENILVVNGSRIKGWWLTHHFISTVCAGIMLIWPNSWSYHYFRTQNAVFTLYTSMVYVMQYYYQSGSLYRLRALGERHDMDITVEGFMSWMWKGLTFLLPFLFIGYFFQLYNAYVLFQLSYEPECREWQVFVLSLIFLTLFLGNFSTTFIVIRQKLKKEGINLTFLKNKYSSYTTTTTNTKDL